jgi:hypothetical protein
MSRSSIRVAGGVRRTGWACWCSCARFRGWLGVDPVALSLYGQRAQTRTDHLGIAEYLGWKTAPAGSEEMTELEQFPLDRAMEHDSPTLLFNLAREYLVSAKVIRPGAIVLAKMIGTARKGAGDLRAQLVGHLVTGEVPARPAPAQPLSRPIHADRGRGQRLGRQDGRVLPFRAGRQLLHEPVGDFQALGAGVGLGPRGFSRRARV